jgi:hypothetical protein
VKLVIHGGWRWRQYEDAFARGLAENGVAVAKSLARFADGLSGRAQQALPFAGPAAVSIGRALMAKVEEERPDAVLFWRPTHAYPALLGELRKRGIVTISYNNDDPFSPRLAASPRWRHRNAWRLYLRALPEFDFNFFYRKINCREALANGARHAEVMLPYFIPWQDRPLALQPSETRFGSDVAFVGHFENDGRDGDLAALALAGLEVRVWGDGTWNRSSVRAAPSIPHPIVPALGEDYSRALAGAKVCLAYLSKLNRDGYTRRCFEIPATGRVMLAERTPELTRLFREDEEACFFASREELVAKARALVADDKRRETIAEAGLRRVWMDGHDVASRAAQFLAAIGAPSAGWPIET